MPPMDFGNGMGPYNPYDPNSQAFRDRLAQEAAEAAGRTAAANRSVGTTNLFTGFVQASADAFSSSLDKNIKENASSVKQVISHYEQMLNDINAKEQNAENAAKTVRAQAEQVKNAEYLQKQAAQAMASADAKRQEAEKAFNNAVKNRERAVENAEYYRDEFEQQIESGIMSSNDANYNFNSAFNIAIDAQNIEYEKRTEFQQAAINYVNADNDYKTSQFQTEALKTNYEQAQASLSAVEKYHEKMLALEEQQKKVDHLSELLNDVRSGNNNTFNEKNVESDLNKARIELAKAKNEFESARRDARSELLVDKVNKEEIVNALRDAKELAQKGDKLSGDRELTGGASMVNVALFREFNEFYMITQKANEIANESTRLNNITSQFKDFDSFSKALGKNKDFQLAVKGWQERTNLKLTKENWTVFTKSSEFNELYGTRFSSAPNIGKWVGKGLSQDNEEDMQALQKAIGMKNDIGKSLKDVTDRTKIVIQQKRAGKIRIKKDGLRLRRESALRRGDTKALNKIKKQEKKLAHKGRTSNKPNFTTKLWNHTPMGRAQHAYNAVKDKFLNHTILGRALSGITKAIQTASKALLKYAAAGFGMLMLVICGGVMFFAILIIVSGFLDYQYSPAQTAYYLMYRQLQADEDEWRYQLTNQNELWEQVKDENFRFGAFYLPWADYASRKPHLVYYDDRFEIGFAGTVVENQVYINPLNFCPAFPEDYFIKIDATGTPVPIPGETSTDYDFLSYESAYVEGEDSLGEGGTYLSYEEFMEDYGDYLIAYPKDHATPLEAVGDDNLAILGRVSAYADHFRDDDWDNDPWWEQFKVYNDVSAGYYSETYDKYYTMEMYLYRFTGVDWPDGTPFMQGAFGDAGIMVEYLPNVSGMDLYGNSGHTSNIKDIICMMDVMFEFEAQSDDGIMEKLGDDFNDEVTMDFVKSYILQLARDSLKLLHNFFVADEDKWPLDTDLESWKHMTTYARTLFHASHQEILDVDVIIFDCTKEPGDEGYLMSTNEELGRADSTDVAYMDTQLGALLHSGCPMQEYGGCVQSKLEAQVYSGPLSDSYIANVDDSGVSNAVQLYYFKGVDGCDNLVSCYPNNAINYIAGRDGVTEEDVYDAFDIHFGLGTYGFPMTEGSDDRGTYKKIETSMGGVGVVGTLNNYNRGNPQFDYVTFSEDDTFCLSDAIRRKVAPTDIGNSYGIEQMRNANMTNIENIWASCGYNEGCWIRLCSFDPGDGKGGENVDLMRNWAFYDSESNYCRYVVDEGDPGECDEDSDFSCDDNNGIPIVYNGVTHLTNYSAHSINYIAINSNQYGSRIVIGGYCWKPVGSEVTLHYSCGGHDSEGDGDDDDDYWHDAERTAQKYQMEWTFYIWSTCYNGSSAEIFGSGGIDGNWNALGKRVDLNNSFWGFSDHTSEVYSNSYLSGSTANSRPKFCSYLNSSPDSAHNQEQPYYCTCKGHDCRFCGGHTLVNVKGIVFSFTDDELAAVGGKLQKQSDNLKLVPVYREEVLGTITDTAGLKGWANTAGTEDSLFGRSYYNTLSIDGINLLIENDVWVQTGSNSLITDDKPIRVAPELVQDIASVRQYHDGWNASWDPGDGTYQVDSMLFVAQDIFDIDASLEWGKGLFQYEDANEYQGWTETNMELAILKYINSWEDTYMFDIPVNLSSPQLSDTQVDDILKAIGGSDLSEGQREAVRLALEAVGNGQYSQEHHSHGYLMYDCNRPSTTTGAGLTYSVTTLLDKEQGDSKTSHHCTCTDASGFCSYIINKGEPGTIWDMDDLKTKATYNWSGWDSASQYLSPGDIVVHYPTLDPDDPDYYKDDNSHHAMVYIGMPSEDLILTWMNLDGSIDFYYTDDMGQEYNDTGVYQSSWEPHVKNALLFKAGEPIFVDCTRLDQTGNIYLRGGYAVTRVIGSNSYSSWSQWANYGYFYMADETMMEYINSGDDMYVYKASNHYDD